MAQFLIPGTGYTNSQVLFWGESSHLLFGQVILRRISDRLRSLLYGDKLRFIEVAVTRVAISEGCPTSDGRVDGVAGLRISDGADGRDHGLQARREPLAKKVTG